MQKSFHSLRGDNGFTDLLGGGRVPKYDPRIEACGVLDEAVAALGLARSLCEDEHVKAIILDVQKDLYRICSELVAPPDYKENLHRITESDVERLENITNELLKYKPSPRNFIIPGKNLKSATLHLARTIVRRAESKIYKIIHDGIVENKEIGAYLNRLSYLLFILAYIEEE